MTILTSRKHGPIGVESVLHDAVLVAGAISVNQDAYTTGLDRIYDVRGFKNMHIEYENTGVANGLTFTIQKARIDYDLLTELVDADFDVDLLADTDVAFGTTNIQDVVDLSPETTAIRIRVKRQTAAMSTTLAGIVSVN